MTIKSAVKRFYKEVTVRAEGEGFAVLLDGRPIKTPAGARLLAPTQGLGDAIAAEWQAQNETVDPKSMALTKLMNTALDRIPPNRQAVIDELAKYANSDLLCYRAESPASLVQRQSAAWDPWLTWVAGQHGAHLKVATGILHVAQSEEALEKLKTAIASFDNVKLTALHEGITLTGSAVLGLAFAARALSAEDAFELAQIDETFQAEQWGRDEEAELARQARLSDLVSAGRFLSLLSERR